MELTNEQKAEKIAQETIQKIESDKLAKANEGKTPEQLAEEAKAVEAKKAEDDKVKAEENKIQEEEEQILEKDEEELTPEEKERVKELSEKLAKESVEQRLKRHHRKTEKRINKLVSRLKSAEEKTSKEKEALALEIATLKEELSNIKKPQEEADQSKAITEAINKMIDEDANKPREQRREMTKDELNEWLLEDPADAHEWMIERDKRREELKKPKIDPKERELANEFIKKQNESVENMVKKYPGTRPKERVLELKGQGKNAEEIHQILLKENDEYRICDEVVKANPDLLTKIDFGDLVAAEIEKRLKTKKDDKKLFTEEEVNARIEEAKKMEAERLSRVDEGAAHSTTKGANQTGASSTGKKSAFLKQLEEEYVRAGLDPAKAAVRLQERAKIPGTSRYHPSMDKDEA